MDFLFIDTDSCVPSVASGKAESMDFMESCAAILIILSVKIKISVRICVICGSLRMHQRSDLFSVHYLLQITDYVHIEDVDRQVVVLTHADS